MTHDDAWAKLDEYLDGALAAGERWAVAAHLNECPECRRYVADQIRLREIVRGRVAATEVPPGLDERLRAALSAEETAVPQPKPIALALTKTPRVAMLLGPIAAGLLLLIWAFGASQAPTPGLPTELITAHLVFAQDTSKLDVTGDAASVESWFRDEAGLSVSVPDIAGYRLSGARLVVMNGQPAAQLVYRSDPDGIYLSLLRFKDRDHEVNLAGAEERDGYAVGQQGITSLVTWARADDRTVLIGEVPEAELRRIADDLSQRLPVLPTVTPLRPRPIPSGEDDPIPSRYME